MRLSILAAIAAYLTAGAIPAHCWTTISPPVGTAAPARRQKSD